MKETIEFLIVLFFFSVGVITIGLLLNFPIMVGGGIFLFLLITVGWFKKPNY